MKYRLKIINANRNYRFFGTICCTNLFTIVKMLHFLLFYSLAFFIYFIDFFTSSNLRNKKMIKYLNPQLIKRKSQYHLDAISFVLFLQNLKNDNTNSIETSKYNQL